MTAFRIVTEEKSTHANLKELTEFSLNSSKSQHCSYQSKCGNQISHETAFHRQYALTLQWEYYNDAFLNHIQRGFKLNSSGVPQ